MKQRYNIGLLPLKPETTEAFTKIAGKIAPECDGYCLGENGALPHVTLCQFTAEGSAIDDIRARINAIKMPSAIRLLSSNLREGTSMHEGYVWAEWMVARDPQLMDAQKKVHAAAKLAGGEPHTTVETYAPHITLGRLTDRVSRDLLALPKLMPMHVAVVPAIGLSTDNGEWIKTLQP